MIHLQSPAADSLPMVGGRQPHIVMNLEGDYVIVTEDHAFCLCTDGRWYDNHGELPVPYWRTKAIASKLANCRAAAESAIRQFAAREQEQAAGTQLDSRLAVQSPQDDARLPTASEAKALEDFADAMEKPAEPGAEKELPDSWGHWLDKDGNDWWIFGKPGKFMAQCLDQETGMPDDEMPSARLQELTGLMRSGWKKVGGLSCKWPPDAKQTVEYWKREAGKFTPSPPSPCPRCEELESRLAVKPGGCQILSKGDACDCTLCQMGREYSRQVAELTAERDRLRGEAATLTADERTTAQHWRLDAEALRKQVASLTATLDTERECRQSAEKLLSDIPTLCSGDFSITTALHVREPIKALWDKMDEYRSDNEEMGKLIGCEHVEDGHARCLDEVLAANHSEIDRLTEELKLWKPMTPEEAEAALAEVEGIPISDEEINAIVERVTDPAYRPTEPEHVKLAAKVKQLQRGLQEERDRLNVISVDVANTNPGGADYLEHLIATAMLGKQTTLIGRKRYEQLTAAERELAELRGRVVDRREI